MLIERHAELIQSDLDGFLAESDRAELQALLDSSEEARLFRDEMLKLNSILDGVPDLEPPAGLHHRILDTIELPPSPHWLARLKNWLQPVSYGLAVAAGMLITVGVVKLLPISDREMTSLVGTMVKQGDGLKTAAHSQLGVDLDAVAGSILLKDLDGTLALQFDLDSSKSVEITVDLQHSGLVFGGFADNTRGVDVFEVSGGNLRVLNEGAQQFVVFLKRTAAVTAGIRELGVTISQDSLRIFEGSIAFGG